MELATAVIWVLRTLLPIVLFWIYFKSQKANEVQYLTGGHGPGYISKRALLASREFVSRDEPAPDMLRDMCMKDATEAPQAFAGTPARIPRATRREREGAHRQRRERPDGERRSRRQAPQGGITIAPENAQVAQEVQAKMHLESLVNYVAFNSKDQLRNFLVDEASAPPPPPKQRRAGSAPASSSAAPGPASKEASAKANDEAKIVLSGALRYHRVDVAHSLLDQLTESQVDIAEGTYSLMIQIAVAAADLKSASHFLMKMESAGCCPDAFLLDLVMELYSSQKNKREDERQAENQMVDSVLDAIYVPQVDTDWTYTEQEFSQRAKLSSAAPAFVPHGGDKGGMDGEGVDTADEATTSGADMVEPEPVVHRTKLTSSAKPFAPAWAPH